MSADSPEARSQGDAFTYDTVLRWEGERHGTLGPTGRRLFTDRIEPALGFHGVFGYSHTTPDFIDPMVLTFLDEHGIEIVLEAKSVTWYPSHLHASWHNEGIEIREWKFITDDDMLVDRVRVTNSSQAPVDLKVHLHGSQTPLLERFRSRQIVVDLKPWAGKRTGVSLPKGAMEHDSIHYDLSASLVLGEVEEIDFDLPDLGHTVAHLNLLVAAPGECEACFEFSLDDHSMERIPWPGPVPGKNHRACWQRLDDPIVQLTYTPPPGRFLRGCAVRKGVGTPVILAATLEIPPGTGRLPVLLGRRDFHGLPVHMALAGKGFALDHAPNGVRRLVRSIHLEAGETKIFNAVLALGPKEFPSILTAQERSEDLEVLGHHVEVYRRWYDDHAPEFTCSDPLLEKCWHYRWFLARHNMFRLDLPNFQLPVFYEGTHRPRSTSVTTLSTPHILSEVRWLKDKRFAQGQIRALLMQQYENGLLPNVRAGERGGFYVHWIPSAALGAYRVNGSLQYLNEVLPLLARNVEGALAVFDEDGDHLPAIGDEAHIGTVGLPSFSYFEGESKLERVEFASYLHASATAVSEGFRTVQDEEKAKRFASLACAIKEAVLRKMWHDDDAFFYALREVDDAKARCREVAGFTPFFTRLAPDDARYLQAAAGLFNANRFESFSPYWQCMAIEGTASLLKHYGPSAATTMHLRSFLEAYTRIHFEEGDPGRPLLERGNPESFLSTYNDLLIRLVGGLVPRMDGIIEIHPLLKHLEHFRFRGIHYRMKIIDITWDKPDDRLVYEGTPQGFTVCINGEGMFNFPELRRVVID